MVRTAPLHTSSSVNRPEPLLELDVLRALSLERIASQPFYSLPLTALRVRLAGSDETVAVVNEVGSVGRSLGVWREYVISAAEGVDELGLLALLLAPPPPPARPPPPSPRRPTSS